MGQIKSLAKDTAIYGISSILGKMLNYLLVPLFTYKLASTSEYGIVTNVYAYVAFMVVVLTFGMETGFFRFVNKKEEYKPMEVFSTSLISVGLVVVAFLVLAITFLQPITGFINSFNPDSKATIFDHYLLMMIIVVSMDALSSIPFAYLRYQQKPIRFVILKMLFIVLYMLLCFFFLVICPVIHNNNPDLIAWFYNPNYGVGYILISNLIATSIQTCCLFLELKDFKCMFNKTLLNKMLHYCFPLLILGIAGIFNQIADKILFPFLYPDKEAAMGELGIYGGCFKIAVIMVMFTQAFRYAYEPLVFARHKEKDNKKAYSEAMKYFIIFGLFIFLGVAFYIDIIKYYIEPSYHEGLFVVPIVMIAELFFGIYFNLSFWYKLTDKTYWGAIFSIIGCAVIVILNILFIPQYGYVACAWASFVGYLLIMLLSYFIGQRQYKIDYDLRSFFFYSILAMVLFALGTRVEIDNIVLRLLYRTGLLAVYALVFVRTSTPELRGMLQKK